MSRRRFAETLHADEGFGVVFDAERVLVERTSPHQHLVLFETPLFGRVLMLDGAVQLTSRDEFIYHEMMSHLPMLAHGAASDVLIVGGGDGGCAEEVLKHAGVRVTLVEVDPDVIAFARQHLADINGGSLDDPRLDLVVGDGMAFVAGTERRFDVIMVDSTDPVGPGAVLFSPAFYAACKRCLKPGGVLVTQAGTPFLQPEVLAGTVRALSGLFADAGCYLATVPTYVGGPMAFGWASDDTRLRRTDEATLAARLAAAGIATACYTPEAGRAAFALPRYVADIVARARTG